MIATNPELEPLVIDPVQAILEQPVSASRLNTFHSCRLKFYFKYIQQLQKPSSPALHLGKSVHASLQEWSKRRWLGKPCGFEEIKAGFDEHWANSLEENPVDFDSGEESLEKSKALGLVEMYLREAPIPVDEKPEAVEVGVEADLSSHGLPNGRANVFL